MLYHLRAPHQELIHILRHMMGREGLGVLDRTWEFKCIFDSMPNADFKSSWQDSAIFPELGPHYPSDKPFQVSGVRLMERAVFIGQGESVLVRIHEQSPEGYDLLLALDDGHQIVIETNDEPLSCVLEQWLARTSQEWHRECFR